MALFPKKGTHEAHVFCVAGGVSAACGPAPPLVPQAGAPAPYAGRRVRFGDPCLPERRTVLTGRFQLVGDHVNMMHGQALCSDAAGEVIGRGEAGSARGRAGSASCPCVIQSSNAKHEDPARSSHPREVDVQRKTPFCPTGLGRGRASMTRNPERLKKERLQRD